MEYSGLGIMPLKSELSSYGNEKPLSPLELAYQVVQSFSDPSSSNIDRMDMINDDYSPLPSLELFSLSDPFNFTFPTNESIVEVMTSDAMPWKNHHHRSSFLPDPNEIENDFSKWFSPEIVNSLESPISVF